VKVRLSKQSVRRLRRSRAKTIESRATLNFGGLPYVVRRTFPVRR
jgi:hypothetical protein